MNDYGPYHEISWLRIGVSAVLLVAGLVMLGHWFVHPEHPHPPEMIVAFCLIVGATGLLPVEVKIILDRFPKWGGEDRRQTCGTCGHDTHPAAPCAFSMHTGPCGCTGQ